MALQDSKSIRLTRVKKVQAPPIMGVDAQAVRARVGARLKTIIDTHGLPGDSQSDGNAVEPNLAPRYTPRRVGNSR